MITTQLYIKFTFDKDEEGVKKSERNLNRIERISLIRKMITRSE